MIEYGHWRAIFFILAEAAVYLGAGYRRMTAQVMLTQTIHHVIPFLTNRSIALFKGTSLVIILGLRCAQGRQFLPAFS